MVDEFKNLYIYMVCKIFITSEAIVDTNFNASTYIFLIKLYNKRPIIQLRSDSFHLEVYNAINSSEA